MWAPPKFTAVWPDGAFDKGWRARSGSGDSSEGGKGGGRKGSLLLRPSKARHPREASRIANQVVESYMVADTYSDYRGVSYVVRTAVRRTPGRALTALFAQVLLIFGLLLAPIGLLIGYQFRRLMCNYVAKFFAPFPVRRVGPGSFAPARLTAPRRAPTASTGPTTSALR